MKGFEDSIINQKIINIFQVKSSGKAHTSEKQFKTSRQLLITEEEICQAQEYFFRKATLEKKHFLKEMT